MNQHEETQVFQNGISHLHEKFLHILVRTYAPQPLKERADNIFSVRCDASSETALKGYSTLP